MKPSPKLAQRKSLTSSLLARGKKEEKTKQENYETREKKKQEKKAS